MSTDPQNQTDKDDLPVLFATIHFRSETRPDGFTDEEIAELNGVANPAKEPGAENAG